MRRFVAPISLLAALGAACALSGCQEAFTTSLAKSLARDSLPVPDTLTKDEAAEYAALVSENRDTALAQGLLPAMADLVADNPGDATVLGEAAVTAGFATGIEDGFMDALDAVDIDSLINDTASLSSDDIAAIAAAVSGVSVSDDAVAIFTALASADASEMGDAGMNATNYAIAAVALIIADAEDQGIVLADAMENGFASTAYVSSGQTTLAKNLITAAAAQWPDDSMISAMQSLFDIL
jgi:hypothetical protein